MDMTATAILSLALLTIGGFLSMVDAPVFHVPPWDLANAVPVAQGHGRA